MLPNNRQEQVKQWSQGSSYSPGTFIEQLNAQLRDKAEGSPSEFYKAEWSETKVRGYRRLIISGQEFTGQRSLVMDVRLGPQTATGEPGIFLRSRAPVGSASEYVIGNKVMPGPKVGGDTQYSIVGSAESIADLARATFQSTTEARTNDLYKRDPLPIDELFAIFTNKTTNRYEKLRERFGVPTGYQLSWGVPSQGEQEQLAAYLPLVAGPGNESEELRTIEKQMVEPQSGLSKLLNLGIFMPKREDTGSLGLTRIAHTLQYQSREGVRETLAMVHRGAQQQGNIPFDDPVAALLKQTKMTTTIFGSGKDVFPVEEVQQDLEGHRRKVLRPRTAYSYENLTAEESSRFGELLLSGDYKRLVNLNTLLPGEEKGRNARLTMGLITPVPTAAGGALIDPRELEGDAGYAFYSGQAFDLPWDTARDMSPDIRRVHGKQPIQEQLSFIKNLIGRQVQAGAQGYTVGSIRVPDKEGGDFVPLTLEGKEYLRQIEGATIVLPPLMSKEGGVFYTAREQADPRKGGTGAELVSTQALADSLTEAWGPVGLNVQTSGSTNVPYLYVNTMGIIGGEPKGLLSTKAGTQPVPDLGVRLHSGTQAGKLLNMGMVTQEVKQPIEAFAGAFAIQPYHNKLEMLKMVDPRLPSFLEAKHTGPEGGLQPVDLEDLGRAYGELTGKPEEGHYLFLMAAMYDRFMTAETKQNDMNMKRFGIFTLQGGGEVSAGVFHESAIKAQQDALDRRNIEKGESLTLKDIGIRTTPAKTEGYHNYYFTAPEKRSLALPLLSGYRAEFPGQGRNINKDIVLSTIANYPEFAQARGIMPGPQPETMSTERRSWLGLMGAYAFNESAMRGEVYKPDNFNQNYATIDQKKAEKLRLSLKGIDPVASVDMTEQERMESIVGQFGWKGMYFEKSGRFLPSPRAAEGVDEYQTIRNLGESRAHYVTQYLGAVEELMSAEASEVDVTNFEKHNAFMGGRESRIGKILSGDPDVVKKAFGNEVRGASGGKYGVFDFLQPGEAYLNRNEIYRLAESMGLKNARQKEELYKQIQAGDESALFYRYPTLDKAMGIAPVRLVSEVEASRRAGFSLEEFTSKTPGKIWIDPHTQEQFVGDRDDDPGGWMLGTDVIREKDGTPMKDLDGNLIFIDELSGDERFQRHFLENRSYKHGRSALERVVGPQRADQYSSIIAPFLEYADTFMARADEKMGGPLKAVFEFGTVAKEQAIAAGALFQNVMTRRGTSHIATSMFKRAAGVLGVPDDLRTEGAKGIAALYQSSLEMNRVAGQMTPMEMLMNTVMFGPEKGNVNSDRLALSGAMKLRLDESEGRHKLAYVDLWKTGMTSQKQLMQNMVKYMTQMDTFGPETIALGLASTGDGVRENYNAILEVLKSSPREDWSAELLGMGSWGNFITKGAIDETSIFGTTFMALGALRTQKLATVGDERGAKLAGMMGHESNIPYAGDMYSVEQFLELPAVKTMATIFQGATGKELGGEGSGFLTASQLEQLEKNLPATARTGSSFADIVLGLGNFFGIGRGKKELRAPGGMATDDLVQQLRLGPGSMRASEMASIVTGVPGVAEKLGLQFERRSKGNYGPAGLLKVASKWIGNLIGQGQMGKIDTMTEISPDIQDIIDRGEQYEKTVALAGTDYLWKRGPIRTPSGYTVSSEGMTMVPHASSFNVESLSAEFDTPVGDSGLMVSKKVTGSADLLGLQVDPETGEEYLHIQELKFGGKRQQSAGVQAVIYRDLLKQMAVDDPAELRKVLGNWQSQSKAQYEQLRKGTPWEGEEPAMADADWVDRAIIAIGSDNIRLSTAHGAGDYSFALAGTRPAYRMAGVSKEIEGLTLPKIISAISDEVTEGMTKEIATQLKDLWTTGSISLVGGSNLDIGPNRAPLGVMEQFLGWMKDPSAKEKIGMPWMMAGGISSNDPLTPEDMVEDLKERGLAGNKFVADAIQSGTKPGERPPSTTTVSGVASTPSIQGKPASAQAPGALRTRGVKQGLTVHRERIRNIGGALVVEPEGRVDNLEGVVGELLTKVGGLIDIMGGGGEGGSGGRGGFGAVQGGGMGGGASGTGDVQKITEIFKGMAAYTEITGGEAEIRGLAEQAETLRQSMADAGMTVAGEIDFAQGDLGSVMSQAEAAVLQGLTLGDEGIRQQARGIGAPLGKQMRGLKHIRKAGKLLTDPTNVTAMQTLLTGTGEGGQSGVFGAAGPEMQQLMTTMGEAAMTPGSLVGSTPTAGAAMLAEMGIDMETMVGKEKAQTVTPREMIQASAELGVGQRQKVYEDAIESIRGLGKAAKDAEAPLVEVAKTAETLKLQRQNIEKDLAKAELPTTRGELGAAMRAGEISGAGAEISMAGIEAMEQLEGGEVDKRAQMEQIAGRGPKYTRLARGIFGGFGWMFLQRAVGMGLRGITEGFEEAQQFQSQQEQAEMRYFGADKTRLTGGAPFYARERAMIAQGQTGLGAAAYNLQTQLTGTAAGDWVTSAKTGFGFGLAGTFLAGELAQAGVGSAAPMMGAAGVVGLLTATIGVPAAMQYSYLQNREGTVARVAAQRTQAADPTRTDWQRWWSGRAADWTQWSNVMTERQVMLSEARQEITPAGPTRPGTGVRGRPAGADPRMRDIQLGGTPFEQDEERLREIGEAYRAGTLQVGEDTQKMATDLIRYFTQSGMMPEGLAGMPVEISTQAMMLQLAATVPGEIVSAAGAEKLGKLTLAGLQPEQIYSAALGAGLRPSVQAMGDVYDLISTEPEAARQQLIGLQAISGISPAARLAMGIGPTAEGLVGPSGLLGAAAQTPSWDMITRGAEIRGYYQTRNIPFPEEEGWAGEETQRRAEIARNLADLPYMRPKDIEEYMAGFPEITVPFREEQATIFGEQQRGRREGYMAQGWDTPQVDAMLGMYQAAFEGPPQAMAWMPEAEQFIQQGVKYGVEPTAMIPAGMAIGEMAARGQYGQINQLMGAMGGEPQAMAMLNMQAMGTRPSYVTAGQWAGMATQEGGMRLPVDVTAAGQITGMQMFQSYIPEADAQSMFGAGYQDRPAGAGTTGATIGGRDFVGQWAIRAEAAQMGFEHQMTSIGIQQQQLALTKEYYLGGPRFGRGLFAVQDAQRGLGYEQTEWQFGRQREQMAMQGQQFRENQALQWQGMQMNRRFKQADWAFQDQSRTMQWGWKQEDFAENVRFMTGRERKLAERQMGRETIMHGMEGENIERQRAQQKEAWGLEDTRFALVKKHFTEQEEFQKEGIKAQEAFYERRRALEEEMVEMQRTYMLEQLNLQEQSIGAQAQYAKDMHEHNLDMISMEQRVAQTVDDWKTAWNYSDIAAQVFQEVYDWLEKIAKLYNIEIPEQSQPPTGHPDHQPEIGEIPKSGHPDHPQSLSTWNSTYVETENVAATVGAGGQEITIYIGNEKLTTFIIDTVTEELHVG